MKAHLWVVVKYYTRGDKRNENYAVTNNKAEAEEIAHSLVRAINDDALVMIREIFPDTP